MDTCRQDVEAAMLNSQGEPIRETFVALSAIAKFARDEVEISEEAFVAMARQAWQTATGD